MLMEADRRVFPTRDDRLQSCTYCGRDLVVLPNDRRGGACFDCLSLIGPVSAPCPECGSEVPAQQRIAGCFACGWVPRSS